MAGEALRHWVVFNATGDVVQMISGLLTEEEKCDVFGRVYDRLTDALIEFEARNAAGLKRLRPMEN